jgi:hypothetical protein
VRRQSGSKGSEDRTSTISRRSRSFVPALPACLAQVRLLTGLGVRAHAVIGRRRKVLTTQALRRALSLLDFQALVLLLFDTDEILERLWNEAGALFPQIAEARFDLVVAPSYSKWSPRPRTEFLIAAKRSLEAFAILQKLGCQRFHE